MNLLTQLCNQGKPLAEVILTLEPGQDPPYVVQLVNALGPDLEASTGISNLLVLDGVPPDPLQIEIQATREALERLFGWVILREHLPRWDPERQVHDGVWPDSFYWEVQAGPSRYPTSLKGRVRSMSLSQPGTNDDGQADSVSYDLPV